MNKMKLFTKIALNCIGIIVFLILSIYISNMLYLKYFLEDMIIDDLKKLSQNVLENRLEGDLSAVKIIVLQQNKIILEKGGLDLPYHMISPVFNSTGVYEFSHSHFKIEYIAYALKKGDFTSVAITTKPYYGYALSIISENLIKISVVFILIGLLVSLLISKHISRRIIRISVATQKIAKGEDFELKDNSSDEVGDLTCSINSLKNSLRLLEKVRREFVANFVHDLKTPIAVIKGYCESTKYLDIDDKEKIKHNIDGIEKQCDYMQNLISNMVELSKISAGIIEQKIEEVDVNLVIEETHEQLKKIAEAENVEIIIKNLNFPKIQTDLNSFRRIINNLVQNAIENTIEKKIYIEANSEYIDIYNKTDLKDEELIFLFERYKSSKKGFGLGLSIVKELCKILNINLETFIEDGYIHFRIKMGKN